MPTFFIRTQAEFTFALTQTEHAFIDGLAEPVISVDTETAPIRGYEGYPNSKTEANAKKREYQEFFIKILNENYELDKLSTFGFVVPTKYQGKFAGPMWKAFYDRFNELTDGGENCDIFHACRKPDAPLPNALVWHPLKVAMDNRKKHDPVQPGLDPYTSDIALFQWSIRYKTGVVVDYVVDCLNGEVTAKDCAAVLRIPNVEFMGQNLKFDIKLFLHHMGYAPRKNLYCTRVASRILTLGLRRSHSLGALAERYLGVELSKDVRVSFIGVRHSEYTQDQIEYAAHDTRILFAIRDRQLELARERNQEYVVRLFCQLSYPKAVWEYEGYCINREKWLELAAEARRIREESAREVELMLLGPEYVAAFPSTGETDLFAEDDAEVDPESDAVVDTRPEAVIRLSQGKLVQEFATKMFENELGQPFLINSLSKDARQKAETEYRKITGQGHPFFEAYARWSSLQKTVSTYGVTFLWYIHPLTGRIHPTFNIAGTDTGRDSSTRPNWLNLPRGDNGIDVRSAIEAPEGFDFENADYDSFEMRAAADVTEDPMLMAVFFNEEDPHSITAALCFHIRQADVTEPEIKVEEFRIGTEVKEIGILLVPRGTTPKELFDYAMEDRVKALIIKKFTRQLAKMCGFLKLFMGTDFTLATRANIASAQAKDVFDTYNTIYSVLDKVSRELAAGPLKPEQQFVDIDGRLVGFVECYGNLRQYFDIPQNPRRADFETGWAGAQAFNRAQWDFKKQIAAIQREAFNHYCQGLNAVVIAEAILALWDMGELIGLRPVLSVYDELLCIVPSKVKPSMAQFLVETAMTEAAQKYLKKVPVGASANPRSHCWKKH